MKPVVCSIQSPHDPFHWHTCHSSIAMVAPHLKFCYKPVILPRHDKYSSGCGQIIKIPNMAFETAEHVNQYFDILEDTMADRGSQFTSKVK